MAKYGKIDHLILESYKSVLEGLSEYLGPGYEMVLHSLENIDHAAIKVINGHYTGRKEGAPITDLAMEMLTKIRKSGDPNTNLVYFNRSKKGVPIRSATLPITGEGGRIIGLLCVNFYMDLPLNAFLDSLVKLNHAGTDVVETFASDSDELILATLKGAKAEVLNNGTIPASGKNKEIVSVLHRKGIFKLKNAVEKVAELMGISKNTVYMHIRNSNGHHEP